MNCFKCNQPLNNSEACGKCGRFQPIKEKQIRLDEIFKGYKI